MSALIFLGALAGIVLFSLIVSKVTGAQVHYLDDWKPEDDERVLFEDRQAYTYLLDDADTPALMVLPRPKRGFVMVTDRRILVGQKPLFSRRFLIEYIMYPAGSPGATVDASFGGQLKRGYQTLLLEPQRIHRAIGATRPYVDLRPTAATASSFDIEAIRIYTDKAGTFPTP
jgi:hypothetical protein